MPADREHRGIRIRDLENVADDQPEGVYAVAVHCTNCDWKGDVAIPKGIAVPKGEPLDRLARCALCGCQTLVRHEEEEVAEVEEPEVEEQEVVAPNGRAFREALEEMMRRAEERERRQPMPAPTQIPIAPSPISPPTPYGQPYIGDPPWHASGVDGPTWISNKPGDGCKLEAAQRLHDAGIVSHATLLQTGKVNRNGDVFPTGVLNGAVECLTERFTNQLLGGLMKVD